MTDIYGLLNEDWNNSSEYEEPFGISPDPEELFNGLSSRTIADDIKLFQSGLPCNEFPIFEADDQISSLPLSDTEIKYNCMWSGSPVSTSYNMSSMDNIESKAVPLAEITGNTMPASLIKSEPIDETEMETQRTALQQQTNQLTNQQNMQNMPPGTSLLLNPRRSAAQQQSQQMSKKNKSNSIQIPAMTKTEFIRERDLIAGSTNSYGRPDTPPSLDDDVAEFKHTCDLSACVVGSNNIKLVYGNDSDKMLAINRLREHLENNDKTALPPIAPTSLTEIMSIISEDSSLPDGDRIPMMPKRRDTSTSSSSSLSTSSAEWNQIDADNAYHPIKHSDHSYTRSKDGIDDISPNLETPSDSDEEIDVVSIGDKKLPTNPSDKDRRVLQSKVANKFVIVKTPKGLLTIPPRRRVSYDYPYTPASVSPVKSGSSLANSRYPSPASTPYSSSQYSSSSSSTSSSSKYNASRWSSSSSSSSRKRAATNCSSSIRINGNIISNSDDFMPASKRHRGKKQKSTSSSSVSIKRHFSMDEVDTIEKRNLHNDMERQRRIGLKNLFEALKKLIPSIKDKERAPKVNILREAAKLCENLTREEQHLSDHKELLKEQLRKRQETLRQLKVKQNAAARAC